MAHHIKRFGLTGRKTPMLVLMMQTLMLLYQYWKKQLQYRRTILYEQQDISAKRIAGKVKQII